MKKKKKKIKKNMARKTKKAKGRKKKTKTRIKKITKKSKSGVKPKLKPKPKPKLTSRKDASIIPDTVHKTKVRVIGIGGGGGTIVSEIISRIKRADFIVANTDLKALRSVKKAKKFQFGASITNGLGTGMNVEVGEEAALSEKERIQKLFEGQDICIIVSTFGGGAGSGATPIFAKLSKNTGCLTYGIFTMPFEFEGAKKMEIARKTLEKTRPHLNAFSVIPNERIFRIIDKNTPLQEALSAINERLAQNLEGLIEMIYLPGLINIDFADLRTILSGRGKFAYLNALDITDLGKEESVKKMVSSPLYSYTIKGAKGIVYNIIGGKAIQLAEVSRISKIISESVNKNAKIIFGINQSQKNSDKIRITLLATGCVAKGIIQKPDVPRPAPVKLEKKEEKIKPPVKKMPKKRKIIIEKKEIINKPKPKPKPKIQQTPLLVNPNQESSDVKLRRNALQVRKAIEEQENELLEKEKIWETPAILRNKNNPEDIN